MTMTAIECSRLYNDADAAGRIAASNAADNEQEYIIRGMGKSYTMKGLCGFGWVHIKPANSKFAKYLLDRGIARRSDYDGGVKIWVSDFGQSYDQKSAYATAFARVLKEAGIKKAYAGSRLD